MHCERKSKYENLKPTSLVFFYDVKMKNKFAL